MASSFLFAGGQSEAELRKELREEHNIIAFPIAQTGASVEYAFMGEDTIILPMREPGINFTVYNLRTQETRSISSPAEWDERRIRNIRNLYHDHTTNVLHVVVSEHRPEENTTVPLYYLLHLDDDAWEEVPELRGIVYRYTYNPEKKFVYIHPFYDKDILVFNMEIREFIERIDLLGEAMQIYAMYGNPLQVLCRTRNEGEYQYYIFDTETRTGQAFPNVEFASEGIGLRSFIHIDGQRFLNLSGQKNEYEVVELDLEAGTQKVVALESFPRELFFPQKVDETHYSFLTRSDDNWLLLCIMEYH